MNFQTTKKPALRQTCNYNWELKIIIVFLESGEKIISFFSILNFRIPAFEL